jgi:hypothetical protein
VWVWRIWEFGLCRSFSSPLFVVSDHDSLSSVLPSTSSLLCCDLVLDLLAYGNPTPCLATCAPCAFDALRLLSMLSCIFRRDLVCQFTLPERSVSWFYSPDHSLYRGHPWKLCNARSIVARQRCSVRSLVFGRWVNNASIASTIVRSYHVHCDFAVQITLVI